MTKIILGGDGSVDFNRIMKKTQIIILMFATIYFPPFCSINTVYFLGAIAWLYLLVRYNLVIEHINIRKALIIYCVFLLIIFYIFGVGYLYTGVMQRTVGGLVYLLFFILPASLVIAIKVKELCLGMDEFVRSLVCVGVIQGLLSVVAFAIAPVHNILLGFLAYVTRADILENWGSKRLYGWANTLTYAMPIAQGVIGIIALVYALRKDRKYLVAVPIIWISGILNARTTLVVVAIGLICVLYMLEVFKVKNAYLLIVVAAVGIGFYIILTRFFVMEGSQGRWIMNGFLEIAAFLRGEKVGYFEYLDFANGEVFKLPEGLNLIFGTGKIRVESDVGYVRSIWAGGILYMVTSIVVFVTLVFDLGKGLRNTNLDRRIIRGFISVLIMIFLAVNVKGEIFSLNEFMNLFLVMYSCFGLIKTEEKERYNA